MLIFLKIFGGWGNPRAPPLNEALYMYRKSVLASSDFKGMVVKRSKHFCGSKNHIK